MKNLKYIKSFYFGKADYRIGDGNGNEVLMTLDYANKKVKLKTIKANGGGLEKLNIEAMNVAKDLLSRKSNVNRVEGNW